MKRLIKDSSFKKDKIENKKLKENRNILKRKGNIIKLIIIIIIVLILGIIVFNNVEIVKNDDKHSNEIFPEQEISDEQLRQTIISLYFYNKETKELKRESRSIDVKVLIDDPYNTIINLLIQGPRSDKLVSEIPINTKINSIKLENNILMIDLFFENTDNINLEKINSQINKTLTELIEVNSIKVLINGE